MVVVVPTNRKLTAEIMNISNVVMGNVKIKLPFQGTVFLTIKVILSDFFFRIGCLKCI